MRKIAVIVLLLGLLSTPGHTEEYIPGPPTGVEATQGTYSDVIIITWDSVSDAYYYVYRDTVLLDGKIYSSIYYDSHDLIPEEVFQYRIQWCFEYLGSELCSDVSLPAYGYVSEDAPSYGPEMPGNDTEEEYCFIATAAYGSYMEPHVMTLRQFRDSYLLTNKLGTKFVEAYYKYSPPMAHFIAGHDSLRSVARIGLAPLVGFSWMAMNHGIMIAWLVLLCLMTLFAGASCGVIQILKIK
jgi:hypothetical protein